MAQAHMVLILLCTEDMVDTVDMVVMGATADTAVMGKQIQT